MPPRARLRLAASAALERQLEFAGSDAVRRMALRTERAAREVRRDATFSEAWLMETVTGIRSRDADASDTLVGAAVAMDLAALAMRFSSRVPMRPSEWPGGAVTLAEAARQLGVSPRSLQRWRREGLACIRVATPRGTRSGLSGEALAWCRERLLGHVKARRRDPARRERLAQAVLREAAGGGSLHAVARRAASVSGASVATARRAVAAAERRGSIDRLGRRASIGPARRHALWRAWRRGVPLEALAAALGRDPATALRAVRRERRDRLRALRLEARPLPTFGRSDAEATLLAPRAVRQDLAVDPWPVLAAAFLHRFRVQPGHDRPQRSDAQRLVALRFLLWKAAAEARTLRGSDPGPAVDRVETSLRWAARLRLALVERAMPGAIDRVRAMRGGRLQGLPPASMRRAMVAAAQAACRAVDHAMEHELAMERPRLAALAALEVERLLAGAGWLRPGTAGREVEVELPASLRDRCVPWAGAVPLRDDLAASALAFRHAGAALLVRRMGWDGRAPSSPAQAAEAQGLDPRMAARRTAEAFRALRGVVGRQA
ncbi:MAG: hypothetical protein EBQ99_08120 [Planctomycetes bacterium]|nr:hypothetical protein [Planctomycetota bacterium]